jgi:hypothetical protein
MTQRPQTARGRSRRADAASRSTRPARLTGLPVLHIDAPGNKQWRRVQSNTAASSRSTRRTTRRGTRAAGRRRPDRRRRHRLVLARAGHRLRRSVRQEEGRLVQVQARPGSSGVPAALVGLMEGLHTQGFTRAFTFTNSSTWGVGSWGSMLWGGGDPTPSRRASCGRSSASRSSCRTRIRISRSRSSRSASPPTRSAGERCDPVAEANATTSRSPTRARTRCCRSSAASSRSRRRFGISGGRC